jgi:hypothetical protein
MTIKRPARADDFGRKETGMKNITRALLGFALLALLFSSLTACVVYDDPYPYYSNRDRNYSRPYYYRPYYYDRSYRGRFD